MKAVQTFTVISQLPEPLEPLRKVAMNLGWLNDQRAQDLFRRVDRENWDDVRDPTRMLALEPQERLDTLAADSSFTTLAATTFDELSRSLESPRWFQTERADSPLRSVAYFSPEFGVAAALPQYSGGLGVLAGDHLKAADELGLPLTAIGLFYHHGYFTQELDVRGWQQERFPRLDPRAMAMEPVEGVGIDIDLAGSQVYARLWKAHVGRIPLYLIDTDVDENDEEHRLITDRLYGGGVEERIQQEILLGVGGFRALESLGQLPQVFHINEGHAGFLALERIRRLILDEGLSFSEAKTAIRPGGVFTTHTPVPAGIDRFPRELMERHFANWCREVGVAFDELMELGHEPGLPMGEVFNMAVMSLRLAGHINGVSKLHGKVSREMFADVWPELPVEEVPISSVTNGVHGRTWVSREMSDLFERCVGPDWPQADAESWETITTVPDAELWTVRRSNRERLVTFARRRLRRQGLAKGLSESQVAWCDEALDPGILTIGFARRFATYKRADLLLHDIERLRRLLLSEERPVQLIIAGKAHPADTPGKELIRQVAEAASDLDTRHRLVFLEDYDISVARVLVAGVDVWLNNPLRPMEACGTSGMKAALNGALNCSILDGWWDELYEPETGWAVPSSEWQEDAQARDRIEGNSLFTILEQQVVPLFYKRDDGFPVEWLKRVKRSLAHLGPEIEASRMLKEYTLDHYEPAAARSADMLADHFERARAFVRWRRLIFRGWPSVAVMSTSYEQLESATGSRYLVSAQVTLGDLDPNDVEVQLVHGAVEPDDELPEPTIVAMQEKGAADVPGWHRFEHELDFDRSGNFGFTVRIVPSHPDLLNPAYLARVAWAPSPFAPATPPEQHD
jgi:starch phosphorylase